MRARAALALLLCASACAADGLDAEAPLPSADVATFAALAQPTLAERCANPSCHGRPGPLELYAELLHRRDPADNFRHRPLTSAELLHNLRECLLRLDLQTPDDSRLLVMALRGPGSGGSGGHGFGPVFADSADAGYQQLKAWAMAAANAAAGAP